MQVLHFLPWPDPGLSVSFTYLVDSMKRLIPISVKFIDIGEFGYLVREITIADRFHSMVSAKEYWARFPDLKIPLSAAMQLNVAGSIDLGLLDTVIQDLILQLNTGEIAGIISTPAELEALQEMLSDFTVCGTDPIKLDTYLIAEAVAKRLV